MRNAIDGLVTQGLIRRVQGKGAYVSRVGQGQHAHATGFRAWVKADESAPSVRQLSKAKRAAGPWYADLFDIDEDDELYSIRRLNSIDGVPSPLEQTLIPVKFFPGIEDVDVSVFSLPPGRTRCADARWPSRGKSSMSSRCPRAMRACCRSSPEALRSPSSA